MPQDQEISTETSFSEPHRLELSLWLIDRLDALRASTANRAAITISADAIFLAATTFLLDQFANGIETYAQWELILFSASISILFILLLLSIFFAANAIAHVWDLTRDVVAMNDLPTLKFFHPPDTLESFPDFTSAETEFMKSTRETFIRSAIGEVIHMTKVQNSRYKKLKTAIRLLLLSILPFLVCIAFLLLKLYL